MARYSPLPSVPIDPRNEAELVQQAAQRVYEASNRTLNDFSSGNPLAALLEGQAFAQGEFLFWANQLPDKILLEWLGPFLGAMRRLGTPSSAELILNIPPSNQVLNIPIGTIFSTDSQRTEGQSYQFVTNREYNIPAGETQAKITVFSKFKGSQNNVPANSIVNTLNIRSFDYNVTNPQPATGGSDVETYREVQERFFTLIRRRNPVSSSDWEDFFIDLFGVGTLTSVQPNRTSQLEYKYRPDYTTPDGNVSLFVLGPDGQELTNQQLFQGQKAINYNLPIENRAFLYPITLSPVQYEITLEINANGPYGTELKTSSLDFRNKLADILNPGSVFPADVSPSVSDVDAAFYSTFSSTERFRDPRIEKSRAYNIPNGLDKSLATYTTVKSFSPSGSLLNEKDLVVVKSPNEVFYPVESDFTPYSINKFDQTLYGNLQLKQIKELTSGSYKLGDVVYYFGKYDSSQIGLHVVKENIVIPSEDKVPDFFNSQKVSEVKDFSPWTEGQSYAYSEGGTIDPEIVEYDYTAEDFYPSVPESLPPSTRPGSLIWLVSKNFTLQQSTNNVTGAQTQSLLGAPVTPLELLPGQTYFEGSWVYTPSIGSGPVPEIDENYYYVDIKKGVVSKYAYVNADFTYGPGTMTVSSYFDSLIANGTLREITWSDGTEGLPIYQYRARFRAGQYLSHKVTSSSGYTYYVSSSSFTPHTTDIQALIEAGLVYALAPNLSLQEQLKDRISKGTVKEFTRMFTFFSGDRTFFREGSEVFSYTATSAVSPLFDFELYLNSGIFVDSDTLTVDTIEPGEYIPFFDPKYKENSEDTIISNDGKNFYRVMRSFVASEEVVDWSGVLTQNSPRFEEFQGNLLRYVTMYECDDDILSQYGEQTSSIKLGNCSITLIPRSSNSRLDTPVSYTFIWEGTSNLSEAPQLSWFTGTLFPFNPPNYKEGTLAL